MRKILSILILFILANPAFAASNSSDAFMSLPFGHTFARTQKRMENSGAKTTIPRKESLTMEGYFEGYPAMFVFTFYKNKLLKTKAVYLQSMGNKEFDKKFYEALQKGFNTAYGSGNERPTANTRSKGKIMLQNVWTPDRYTTITLTYNPEMSKKLPGSSLNSKFIQLIYKSDKWD